MRTMGLAVAFAIWISSGAQTPAPSGRAAALRFVIANGLALPPGRVALALESDFQVFRPYAPPKTAAEQLSAAVALGKEVSASRVETVDRLLWCVSGRCVPKTQDSVVVINEPETASTGISVFVRVFLASDKPQDYDGRVAIAVVQIEQRGGGWVGVGYKWPLAIAPVRLDGK